MDHSHISPGHRGKKLLQLMNIKRKTVDETESMAFPMDSECESETGTYTQTEEMFTYMSPVDLLALTAELAGVKLEIKSQMDKIYELEEEIKLLKKPRPFSVEAVNNSDSKIKTLFQFYTGLTHVRFLALLAFLVPPGDNICYEGNRKDTQQLSTENGLFLTLCRLQQNFAFPDLAMRFDITKVFWCNFFRLGLRGSTLSYVHLAFGQVSKPLLKTCQQSLELTSPQHSS